jgi:cyclase
MRTKLRVLAVIPAFLFAAAFAFVAPAAGQAERSSPSDGPVTAGKFYSFQKIADGVFYTTSTGPSNAGGNHIIIVGDSNVVLVDAGSTPSAARALLEDMKLITDKPVRYVINTHFHWDHTDGNSVFGPGVDIVGQDYVRHALKDLDFQTVLRTPLTTIPAQIDNLNKQIAAENDPQKKAALQKRLTANQGDLDQIKALKPFLPTMTYSTKMTLYQGDREIQLLYLGPGHTEGDTVVFLPKERIVCTGDLMESGVSYVGDGMFGDWGNTLDALKKLDFDTILPGHGVPFHDKAHITAFQSYLTDFVARVAVLRAQGLTPEDAAPKVDMTSHQADFPGIRAPGVDVRGVRRAYDYLATKSK